MDVPKFWFTIVSMIAIGFTESSNGVACHSPNWANVEKQIGALIMEQYINGELSPESQAKVDYIRERPIYYDDKR